MPIDATQCGFSAIAHSIYRRTKSSRQAAGATHIRLVFFGSPDVAASTLWRLAEAGHDVALVLTQRDRRRGRGGALIPTPVKQVALELDIPVSHRLVDVLDVDAKLGVVVAFGRIIPAAVLEEVSMVNLHLSLLPRWRGAAPVERAILAGDSTTGVSLM